MSGDLATATVAVHQPNSIEHIGRGLCHTPNNQVRDLVPFMASYGNARQAYSPRLAGCRLVLCDLARNGRNRSAPLPHSCLCEHRGSLASFLLPQSSTPSIVVHHRRQQTRSARICWEEPAAFVIAKSVTPPQIRITPAGPAPSPATLPRVPLLPAPSLKDCRGRPAGALQPNILTL